MQILFSLFFALNVGHAQENLKLPSSIQREQMFRQVVSEINRLDGEGLVPRSNRPEDWKTTTDKLALEAKNANTLFDFGIAFKKLDATYPNLHAQIHLHKDLDATKEQGSVKFHFVIRPDLKSETQTSYRYYIKVKTDTKSDFKNGDELIAINGLSVEELEQKNFIFCKFPLFSQCAQELFDNLRHERLHWNRRIPLEISVNRNGQKIIVKPILEAPTVSKNNSQPENDPTCEDQLSRYKNFELDFKGYNLCAYRSNQNPKVLLLRIKSFVYGQGDPIGDLTAEVDLFWFNYWRKNSDKYKTIIFDVIENTGGQSPIPYYGLFAQKPYQEQYTQFKKIKEFERKDIFESLFWGDKAKEIWLDNIKKDGSFSKLSEGDFLPPVPQFCADQTKDCREGLFQPKKHKFNGNIKILLNAWCISSCVGFVDNMAKIFKGKVKLYGHPDSGDSAYSRATIATTFENNKIKIDVIPLKKAKKPDPPEPWVRQIVSVTRSTDREGKIISGKVQKVDYWIPRPWSQSDDDWQKAVFEKALKF
jgi:hypothetical protein